MVQIPSPSISAGQPYEAKDAKAYLLEKLATHDIVFAGTVHRQPSVLKLMAELIPCLHQQGVTHLALEIASDQQGLINRFFKTGQGLDAIQLHHAIDCHQYRELFNIIRLLGHDRRPEVVAIDLPVKGYGGPISRNEYMAAQLASIVQSTCQAKVLTMVGGLHVLRKLNWHQRVRNGHEAIRAYLEKRHPELSMFSLVHIIDGAQEQCDFSRYLGPLPGTVAMDLDERFKGWRLGMTACMALKPSQPFELVDGVIVY